MLRLVSFAVLASLCVALATTEPAPSQIATAPAGMSLEGRPLFALSSYYLD